MHGWTTSIHIFIRLITTWTWGNHHLPPYSILYDWSWRMHPNVILSWDSTLEVLKLGLSSLWRPIISCVNLHLRWGLKQSCSPHQEISNDMLHATCMYVIQSNSRLLMVGSQIDILIPSTSFGHDLYCKYSNESCEPFINI